MFSLSSLTASCGNSLLNAFKLSSGALSATFVNPVRYRYHEDKPAILKRRWGYKDKMDFRGTLPRVASGRKYPLPEYVPSNNWSERKALFGQNDYIDILGDDDTIPPIKFAYNVPLWLRGFQGKEYHMLLRKQRFFGSHIRAAYPQTHLFIRKRLKHLYWYMNRKTKHFMDKKVMRR